MLHLGILKTFDSQNHKAGVQLAGSLTTYLDDISVSVSIASSAMVVGNYVLVAIPGGNPRDACVVASWPAGSSGGGGGSKIQDADGDTYLWVEKTADEDKIHGVVKNVEAFLLDDNGVLTAIKQTSAKGNKTNAQSIPNTSWTKVLYNTTEWDSQGNFDVATDHRFEATVAGYYYLQMGIGIQSMPANSTCVTRIRVNTADKVAGRMIFPFANDAVYAISTIVALAAGDYVDGQVYQNSGGAKPLWLGENIYNYLTVHKLT